MDQAILAGRFARLAAAAKALYVAAHWAPDRECDAAALWTELRDAAGMPAGTSPPRDAGLEELLEDIIRGDQQRSANCTSQDDVHDGEYAKKARAALARIRR